ncbi:MAG TPA: hypothetical protein V6D11_04860 [Waterburya sp.]
MEAKPWSDNCQSCLLVPTRMGESVMPQLLDSPQPTINVCAQIKCPFFHDQSPSPQGCAGCARYSNSGHCHLTSVFAFTSDQHWLFTTNETALSPVKLANDGWIAKDKVSQRQHKHFEKNKRTQPLRPREAKQWDVPTSDSPCDRLHAPTCSIFGKNFQPISISVLNSIQFEEY